MYRCRFSGRLGSAETEQEKVIVPSETRYGVRLFWIVCSTVYLSISRLRMAEGELSGVESSGTNGTFHRTASFPSGTGDTLQFSHKPSRSDGSHDWDDSEETGVTLCYNGSHRCRPDSEELVRKKSDHFRLARSQILPEVKQNLPPKTTQSAVSSRVPGQNRSEYECHDSQLNNGVEEAKMYANELVFGDDDTADVSETNLVARASDAEPWFMLSETTVALNEFDNESEISLEDKTYAAELLGSLTQSTQTPSKGFFTPEENEHFYYVCDPEPSSLHPHDEADTEDAEGETSSHNEVLWSLAVDLVTVPSAEEEPQRLADENDSVSTQSSALPSPIPSNSSLVEIAGDSVRFSGGRIISDASWKLGKTISIGDLPEDPLVINFRCDESDDTAAQTETSAPNALAASEAQCATGSREPDPSFVDPSTDRRGQVIEVYNWWKAIYHGEKGAKHHVRVEIGRNHVGIVFPITTAPALWFPIKDTMINIPVSRRFFRSYSKRRMILRYGKDRVELIASTRSDRDKLVSRMAQYWHQQLLATIRSKMSCASNKSVLLS